VAGRPAKTLLEHVRQGTFRPGRHGHLLAGPDLPWPALARLQSAFRAATSEAEREAVVRAVSEQLKVAHAELARRVAAEATPPLEAALAALGRPGSFRQLERFFPHFLAHQAGERAGQPFQLERFQREFLKEFWRRDEWGRRLYTVALLGIPKGNGKTPLAAGLGLHALLSESDAPEVYGIAGSKDQAGIAQRYARGWVEQGELGNWLTSGAILRCPERNGFYKLLSSDGRLGHGVNPSAAIVDEWWLFSSERERESYNALAQALHKRGQGRAWLLAISTAGFDKQGQLGRVYERAIDDPRLELHQDGFLRVLRDTEAGFLFWWYGLPENCERDPDDPKLVRACNPASWIEPKQLLRDLKRPDSEELDWRRLHLNQWTASREAWLPAGTWAALCSEAKIPEGAEIYLGVDIGISHDMSAVAWAHRLGDGRILLGCRTWSVDAKAEAKAHQFVAGGQMRLELVEGFIRELGRRYRVCEVAYDPHFFARSAQLLEEEGFKLIEFLPSSQPMAQAYQDFYQACIERTISHDGDPVLAAHVAAAAADRTERGWKLRKLKASQPFDACVAAVLAHARARVQEKRRRVPQIFWMETGW
jgi:phage terminase large subunit-like protein